MPAFGIRKTLRAIAIVLALAIGYLALKRPGGVTSSEARRLVDAGARLVDVRTPQEFAAGHIPRAINIPVQELDRRMGELASKDGPVVLYCRSGNRSSRAASMLKSAGYAQIYDLGAMSGW